MFLKSQTYLDTKPLLRLPVRYVDANGDEPVLRVQPLRSRLPTPLQENCGKPDISIITWLCIPRELDIARVMVPGIGRCSILTLEEVTDRKFEHRHCQMWRAISGKLAAVQIYTCDVHSRPPRTHSQCCRFPGRPQGFYYNFDHYSVQGLSP
jgi:hypothetical protein